MKQIKVIKEICWNYSIDLKIEHTVITLLKIN